MEHLAVDTSLLEGPMTAEHSRLEGQRHDRDLHRVAQDYDDDALLLEEHHGHSHVIVELQQKALDWRRQADHHELLRY